MEWISVEDKLPPRDVYVLIAKYDPREGVEMHFIQIAARMNKVWIDDKDGEILNLKHSYVTHWMPLPDKPNE